MVDLVVCSPTPALRAGLRALISADPGLSVTAALPGLEDLPGWAPHTTLVVATPDAMPAGWQADAAGETSDLAILLVSDDPRDAQALLNLDLRAWGLVSPEAPAETLQAAVRALAEGLAAAPPAVLQQLAGQPRPLLSAAGGGADGGDEPAPADRLTGRETEVLRCLAQGLTNKQIALALHISEHTVKFHVSSIYAKLGASNRTEASRKGARLGIVPL